MDTGKITVEGFDLLCKQIVDKETEIEAQEEITKKLNKELAKLEGQAVQYLKDLGRDKYDSPYGKASIDEKWRVNLPATDQEKMALFEHLRERKIFEKYATINSKSLNALYMADWEAAKAKGEGMTFNMPGIGAAQLFEKFNLKKAKKK